MSLNATTLSGAIGATDTRIKLAAGTGVAVNKFIRVDDEMMQIQNIDDSPVVAVIRGVSGSAAVAHATGAAAVIGLGSDFPPVPAPRQYTYAVAGAVTPAPGLHILNTGAASAMTIADPGLNADGTELTITCATAHAYTLAGVFNAGGGGADLITFAAAVGNNVTLSARQGKWLVLGNVGGTIS